jgi:hypothetical protein
MKQPDFTKIFFDYFGGKPRKVSYEMRIGPCFLHDLTFLTSLVHDARFFRKDITLRGRRLTIPLNRDCWEIPMTSDNELHAANAKLVFATVQDLKWVFQGMKVDPNQELWIDSLCINESYRSHSGDRFDFIICGHGWQLGFTLDDIGFTIRLQDIEVPYLYSKKK